MTLPLSDVKSKGLLRKTRLVLWGIGISIPPVLILLWINRFAVNVPIWDGWEFIPLLYKLRAGEINFTTFLLAFHNEHRLVFPRLISYLATFFPRDYLFIQMYVGVGLKLLSLVFIWQLLKLTFKEPQESGLIWPLTLVASWLLFSTVEVENWIWAFDAAAWNLPLLCAIVMVWLLAGWPGRWKGTLIAAVPAIIGTFSLAHGVILWGVGFLGIMAYGWPSKGRSWWLHLMFWMVAAFATMTLYFTSWGTQETFSGQSGSRILFLFGFHQNLSLFLSKPIDFGAFILAFLGSPFSKGSYFNPLVNLIGLTGLIGLGTVAYWLSHYALIRPAIPWLLLALFTIVTALFTAIGRFGYVLYYPNYAQSSRYSNISLLFWVSTVVVVCLALSQERQRRPSAPFSQVFLTTFLAVWLSLGHLTSYIEGYYQLADLNDSLTTGLSHLYNYETESDESLSYLYYNPPVLKDYAGQMESLGLGVFAANNPWRYLHLYAEPVIPAEAATGELIQGIEIAQTFVSRCKQLGRFDLLLATYGRVNTQPVVVRLTDETSGQVVYEKNIPGPAIEDKGWQQFVFEPLPGSALKPYRISLVSPTSRPGDAITVWHSQSDVYAGGELLVNEQPTGVDLAFRYGCGELPQGITYLGLAPDFPAWPSISQGAFTHNNESQEVIATASPSSIVWPLILPAGKRIKLKTGLAINPALGEQAKLSDGVSFNIYVDRVEQSEVLLSQDVELKQPEQEWLGVELDLSQYAGQVVSLRLETGPGPANNFDYDWVGWVSPVITISPL